LLAQLRIVAAIGNAVLRSARAERRDELRLQAEHVVLENRETRAVGGSVAIFRAELLGLAGLIVHGQEGAIDEAFIRIIECVVERNALALVRVAAVQIDYRSSSQWRHGPAGISLGCHF